MIKNLESLRIGEIVAFTTNQSNLPLLQPGRGTKRDMSGEPHWVTYLLDEPIVIAGEERYESIAEEILRKRKMLKKLT
jgi:hypothetical protein